MRYNAMIHQIPRRRPQTSYGLAGSTYPKVYLCSNCLAERVSGHGDTCPRCTAIADLHSETLGVSEFTYRLMVAVSMLAAVAVLLAAFLYLGQI